MISGRNVQHVLTLSCSSMKVKCKLMTKSVTTQLPTLLMLTYTYFVQ